jgi:hypothetical protein
MVPGRLVLTVPRVLRKSARCFRLIFDLIDLPIVVEKVGVATLRQR